ncbi:MAG TPA: hypothetical protein VKB31_00015 [Trueperaceae bacterium]|nr:hypothetical protein [Trueperaceae bacterium]
MSEEPKHTYSALEIVEEFFPATPTRLIPRERAYRLERDTEGAVRVVDAAGTERLRMTPVERSGDAATHVCCDLCHTSSAREDLHVMRSEIPGSAGRRFRYLMACRDTDACEARRLDDAPVELLLRTH